MDRLAKNSVIPLTGFKRLETSGQTIPWQRSGRGRIVFVGFQHHVVVRICEATVTTAAKAAYRRAVELGLHNVIKPHGAEEGALDLLNGLYAAKELEYIRTGMKHFPTFALVSRLAVTLHNAIAPHVGFKNTFAINFPNFSAN